MPKRPIWTHLITWAAIYIFWIAVFQNHALTISRTMTIQFCYLLFIAANYYFNLRLTIPGLLYRKRYIAFGSAMLGGIAMGAVLRALLAVFMNKYVFQPPSHPVFMQVLSDSLLNIGVWVICLVAAHLIFEKIRFQQYIDAIEKQKTKNELDFLKAQFNPHFLFNSINSIYGHIDKGNRTARNMLLTFSEMLRYQLYECNVDEIPIEKELNYIRNYVAIQQTRKEEDLVVRQHIGTSATGFQIAPLLFIAFIENAFKYVSTDAEVNRVDISLDKQDEELTFAIFNTKDSFLRVPIDHQGIGIANVKRRLELLYPGRHSLLIEEREESYRVLLKIKVHEIELSDRG